MYTAQDTNAVFADEAIKLDDVSWFMSPERIVDIAKRYVRFPSSIPMHVADNPLPFAEPKAPTYAQATVSSARVPRLPPSLPPQNLDDQMAARTRHRAYLLSRDIVVAQDGPFAPGTHVKSTAHDQGWAVGEGAG
ncbi:hypothetical protein FIBSPDRAFT_131289 [Athelia psychrophila]|uniref:Uncharacterized protein n=1 Tax=Athelia psychrophila TaxID=1759441 RepID=A0A166CCS6_9AGAM|nr:hypothetical protein FIBSPDRAFT_131289 [Fibularhizoctonia sp. CBS 109695]